MQMLQTPLPTADAAFRSLCANGDPYTTAPLRPRPLGDVSYHHGTRGSCPVAADERVLRANGIMYARDPELLAALRAKGVEAMGLEVVEELIALYFEDPRLILGVSGYATIGYSYQSYGEALGVLYQYIATRSKPSLVCDGGAGAGVLGLNGLLAMRHGIPSLGFTPLQGMATMSPRNHTAIFGSAYRDREGVVGLTSDVLVCAGGAQGTLRECLANIRAGGSALLLLLDKGGPDSLANTWHAEPDLVAAQDDKRFVVCESLGALASQFRTVWHAGAADSRATRFKAIGSEFA